MGPITTVYNMGFDGLRVFRRIQNGVQCSILSFALLHFNTTLRVYGTVYPSNFEFLIFKTVSLVR